VRHSCGFIAWVGIHTILNHVQRTALGHWTGERTFALMQERLGDQDLYAGVGEVLLL